MHTLSVEYIRRRLDYNPVTGEFFWKETLTRKIKPGAKAGTPTIRGYVGIGIDKTIFYAHRLAWAHFYGRWPRKYLDHIDRDGTNNAIANLRECTGSQNLANQKRAVHNTSGYKGVHRRNDYHRNETWVAQICIDGKGHHLGVFQTPEEAHAAYLMAAKKHFGEFARGE